MATTKIYCTSFCNKGHRLSDGKPVDHECYVLNVDVLRAEAKEGAEAALALALRLNLPIHERRIHKGIKTRVKAFEVVEHGTGKIVHVVKVSAGKSESQLLRIEAGLMRNMDAEKFWVREVRG